MAEGKWIGGLTAALSSADATAFVRGAQDGGAIGVSFYDFATGQDGWAPVDTKAARAVARADDSSPATARRMLWSSRQA